MEKVKVTVIFPARNEEELIKSSVLDVYKYLGSKNYNYEIIVVVNGSTDNTEDIVVKLSRSYPEVKLVKSRQGYGFALRKGLKFARGKYIVIFNVDFYDLHLLDFVDIDLVGKDLIIGSKMTYWSVDKRPLARRLVSKFFNLYLKIFFGFAGSDTHGIKAIRANVVKKILPACKTYSGIFDTEFVLKSERAGYKLMDLPVFIEEKRMSRFGNRLWQTPRDLYCLHKSLEKK